jgi:hypothetical protein
MDGRTPVIVRCDPHGDVDADLRSCLEGLVAAFDQVGLALRLPPRDLVELVIAKDLASKVRSLEGTTVGVEGLTDFGVERVGGIVAGKTMFRSQDHSDAIVIISAEVLCPTRGIVAPLQVFLVAHELAHTVIGRMRSR